MGTVRRCHPRYDNEGNLIENLLVRGDKKFSDPGVSQQSSVETSDSNNLPESISPEWRTKYDQQMHNLLRKSIKVVRQLKISQTKHTLLYQNKALTGFQKP